ncbi:S1C family serine protease [Humisphaera borealis]|uniref:Trypsin-like peptidase domain-containing protein n=1 Tax=Humisphaera borealis TaxID=2807512 RepID=A0A7M2WTI6_9BACT|nr:trypsin-like peptidase domain-containing protein [Humisphaera borealis]QOV88131.1 trypsin-like peptidase domain-containing protein [Humisphaera borealis]
MGHGYGRYLKLSLLSVAGLGFLASCAGTASPPAITSGQVRADKSAGDTGEARLAALHVDDSFDAPRLEKQFEVVARKVIPSVVAISAIETPLALDDIQHPGSTNPEKLNAALEALDRTVGTGFVIDSAGYIVTNEHVIGHAAQIWVTTDDQRVYPAVVVGSDPRSDLAVLKIAATHLPPVTLATGETRRGQWTMAVGNPYGLAGDGEMSVSIGVVSAVGRSLPKLSGREDRLYQDLIQTTAQINPGNSGGPLFDLAGNVIGVNCAVILPVKQVNGIGFALPMGPRVRSIIDRLKSGQEVTYGYLGVRTSTPTDSECRAAGLPGLCGARVDFIEPNSPAADADLKAGDIIASLGGSPVRDSEHFIRSVGDAAVGKDVSAKVYRGGKSVAVKLRPRQREVASAPVTIERQRFFWRGLQLGPAARGGVAVVSVDAQSPLAGQVKKGDVLESLAGIALRHLPDVLDVLSQHSAAECGIKVSTPGTVVSARE